ncbi:hypothetical protein TNCV_4704191 [Trichonephila clavipes]|nr:hypothetical protein TNCV_4704191 [Trichonephila clavipes]
MPVVIRSFEHHTGDSTIQPISTPILREKTLGVGIRASHLSIPSTNLMRGFAARRLFKVPTCREGAMQLQTSMPFPGLEARLYGYQVAKNSC